MFYYHEKFSGQLIFVSVHPIMHIAMKHQTFNLNKVSTIHCIRTKRPIDRSLYNHENFFLKTVNELPHADPVVEKGISALCYLAFENRGTLKRPLFYLL